VETNQKNNEATMTVHNKTKQKCTHTLHDLQSQELLGNCSRSIDDRLCTCVRSLAPVLGTGFGLGLRGLSKTQSEQVMAKAQLT
jgi:hypothetical protein